jgi:SAM-dependent methyltransferase
MTEASNPFVFDRYRVRAHRDRAAQHFHKASFLKERAIEDVCDRLGIINRTFACGIELGSYGDLLPKGLASRLDLSTKIDFLVQCDLSGAMIAKSHGPRAVCDEEALPFGEASLDVLISTLGLQWVNDVPGFLAQARMALRPDGLLLISFLGGRTLQELRAAFATAEADMGLTPSPRVSPFADAQDGARLLQRAGFALPVADSDVVTVRYANAFGLFRDLKAMGETAAFAGSQPRLLTRTLIALVANEYARNFADPDGRVRATFEIVTLTGWVPHHSQQKPLKPGSAKMRLADALGTTEISSGDKPG